MSNKNLPPPASKLHRLKLKLKASCAKLPNLAKEMLAYLLLVSSLAYVALSAPQLHDAYLRQAVGSKVYKITTDDQQGAGTGFSVKVPSGQTYIVTNSHVCNGVLEAASVPGTVLVVNGQGAMRRRVIAISDKTDLCLIEGLPGVDGLSLASESDIGDNLTSFGHPLLEPLTSAKGEVIAKTDLQILDYVMKSGNEELDGPLGAKDGKCDLPKNKIEEQTVMGMSETGLIIAKIKLCTTIPKSVYQTNMVLYPGNSGSPAVNALGHVVGVVFAIDGRTHYGYIVNFKDL